MYGNLIYFQKNLGKINIYSYSDFAADEMNSLGLNLIIVDSEYSIQIMVEEFINLITKISSFDIELL